MNIKYTVIGGSVDEFSGAEQELRLDESTNVATFHFKDTGEAAHLDTKKDPA